MFRFNDTLLRLYGRFLLGMHHVIDMSAAFVLQMFFTVNQARSYLLLVCTKQHAIQTMNSIKNLSHDFLSL